MIVCYDTGLILLDLGHSSEGVGAVLDCQRGGQRNNKPESTTDSGTYGTCGSPY